MPPLISLKPSGDHFSKQYRLAVLFLCFSLFSLAQDNYSFRLTNDRQGLGSNLVKDVVTDDAGVCYVATDKGVYYSRTNRIKSVPIPQGGSEYFKRLYKFKDGSVWALSDNSIYRIQYTLFGPRFEFVLSNQNYLDNLPMFSKSVLERENGEIWLGDHHHIYKYHKGNFIKYAIDKQGISNSYHRSFQLFESKGKRLQAFSQSGYLYSFNEESQGFVRNAVKIAQEISAVHQLSEDRILVGADTGLIILDLDANGQVVSRKDFTTGFRVSAIQEVEPDRFLVGSWTKGLYFLTTKGKSLKISPVKNFPAHSVNAISSLDEQSWLIATNSGLVSMQKQYFIKPFDQSYSSRALAVESGKNGDLYISTKDALHYLPKGDKKNHRVLHDSRFVNNRCLSFIEDTLWLGQQGGVIRKVSNGEIAASLKFGNEDVQSILSDHDGSVWIQGTHTMYHLKNNQTKTYLFKRKLSAIIRDTRGVIVSLENDWDDLLYRFDESVNDFVPMSVKLDFVKGHENVHVNQMLSMDGLLYIASSQGLLKLRDDTLDQIRYSEDVNDEVFSIAYTREGDGLWVANKRSLVHLSRKGIRHYNHKTKLGDNYYSSGALELDQQGRLWMGTNTGAVLFDESSTMLEKKPPVLELSSGNEQCLASSGGLSLSTDDYLKIRVLNLRIPLDVQRYEYALQRRGERKEIWKEVSYIDPVMMADYGPGDYILKVRNKDTSLLDLQDSSEVRITIKPLWYLSPWAIGLYLLSSIIIVLSVLYYQRRISERERKILEQKVEERTEELSTLIGSLAEMNKTKERFVSIISHDLKNPIGAISSLTDVLEVEGKDSFSASQFEILDAIRSSSQNAYKLLEDLLVWSRSQSGKLEFNAGYFDIESAVLNCFALLNGQAKSKGIDLINACHGLEVFGDQSMVETVIRNLLSNAIKFTDRNKSIRVSSFRDGGQVCVKIEDEGKGMSSEQVNNLFRIEKMNSTFGTEGESGSGLGLILCKDFMERNKATISVESKLDLGTTFTLHFPTKGPDSEVHTNQEVTFEVI